MIPTTQGSFSRKKNRRFAPAFKRGKAKAKARAGSITGDRNNSKSAVRKAKVAEGSCGGGLQEDHPRKQIQVVPHLSS